MKEIRLLRADEIECRVGTDKNNKVLLLLYKDARVDMSILDETFGMFGWQRTHEVVNGNLFCCVEIWDDEKKQWVRKQDVGVESNTEKQKGEASDSFKRACFNVGIGRELYTSPIIKITTTEKDYWTPQGGKPIMTSKFMLHSIGYNENREINFVKIVDQTGKERFAIGVDATPDVKQPNATQIQNTDNPITADDLILAIQEIAECKTDIELDASYQHWSAFHSDKRFILSVGVKDFEVAKDLEEVKSVWLKWKGLQSEAEFVKAKEKRKTEVK